MTSNHPDITALPNGCHTYGTLGFVKKTTIYLDETDDVALSRAAARRGASRTELIREAIRSLLEREASPGRRPRPLGGSGHDDTSQRVDEILADGFGR